MTRKMRIITLAYWNGINTDSNLNKKTDNLIEHEPTHIGQIDQ